jgi:hypothetical protein
MYAKGKFGIVRHRHKVGLSIQEKFIQPALDGVQIGAILKQSSDNQFERVHLAKDGRVDLHDLVGSEEFFFSRLIRRCGHTLTLSMRGFWRAVSRQSQSAATLDTNDVDRVASAGLEGGPTSSRPAPFGEMRE